MPYITVKQPPKYYQMTFEDIMAGIDDLSKYVMPNITSTRTYWVDHPNSRLLENTHVDGMIGLLAAFNKSKEALFTADRASLYHTFHIPKSSGGLRRIDAPQPELMNALRELKTLFETHMFALYHTTAFAYVRGRSTIDAIKRHQRNESKWFLKLDFADFFGSTTPSFVMAMMSLIFPFSEIVKYSDGRDELQKALSLCFLNGGLPQGTPISPFITNVMMIAIDHKISNSLRNFDNRRFVYTRYADDLLISCKIDFDMNSVQQFIIDTLAGFNAPFTIKKEKTRYGSSAGRNWNLGLMLNNENQITIGHKKKKQFKAMLDNYMRDRKSGIKWELHDIQVLSGLISYYKMVEQDYINYLLNQYSEKHGTDIRKCIKADLSVPAAATVGTQ
ncbi:MAG: reverse transcriptase family protein [Oscillospiraceae bacterium]|nr:reverse transcriptase family protein [Oscillospiraceae bacterium]